MKKIAPWLLLLLGAPLIGGLLGATIKDLGPAGTGALIGEVAVLTVVAAACLAIGKIPPLRRKPLIATSVAVALVWLLAVTALTTAPALAGTIVTAFCAWHYRQESRRI